MSTFSLPQLVNGGCGGLSGKPKVDQKYASLSRCTVGSTPKMTTAGRGRERKMEMLRSRRLTLNRDGSIGRNQFRGVKKHMLETETNNIIHSMTVDELYEEILFEILHTVGSEFDTASAHDDLFHYVQEAFKMVNDRHDELLRSAEMKEAPEHRLNVEIVEAKELTPKDPNGLADPFVTMYIASSPSHRYNTSVKTETLNPTWEEHFSLPINESAKEDTLVIEVWDFDAAETVGEKVSKIFDVKGIKGLRKLMKEIAVTASTGKHDNELVGRCNIALKTIPATGLVMWFSLDKKSKLKRQGLIQVRLSVSAEKNQKVAAQEHRQLLQILLEHELETSKAAPYTWSGQFTELGEAVIIQHSVQSGLSSVDSALVQWSVYTLIHPNHHLSFALFESLLDKLIKPVQTGAFEEAELKSFWEGVRKLLPSCFSVVRKLRKKTIGDKNNVKMLNEVLSLLSKVALLEPPEGTDLFPMNVYGWLQRDETPSWDIHGTLLAAVISGSQDWYTHISKHSNESEESDEDKLQYIIKLVQLVRSDLQRSIEFYEESFQEKIHFPFARTCYVYYEEKLSECIKPIIIGVCQNLPRINLPNDRVHQLPEHEEVNMGTTLFEVYLLIKKFSELGSTLSPVVTEFMINEYAQWFTAGVLHWLDISFYKALIRIEKAIELDRLQPVDEMIKCSSSAVDTLAIFYQIKVFWQQLSWPDVDFSYTFVAKIVDDICRCCVFYADRMETRLQGLGDVSNVYQSGAQFQVTREWCLAINNIDYIRQSLPPFVKELHIEDIITKLADYRSAIEADRCAETLKNFIDNAVDTAKNKILVLIEIVAQKMSPAMRRFLTEGAELLHQDSNSLERLMMYLEDSLKMLNSELNEINFERVLDTIWTELAAILYDLVQSNLDKRRPPSFFSNLRDCLQIMRTAFKSANQTDEVESSDHETLESIDRLLELHAYETSDLINQYYLEQHKSQSEMTTSPYGQLTVRCWFKGNNLEIDVMNGRELMPMDSNGLCDPFVRIHFIPEEKFANVTKPKTNTQSKTLFPLFDEKFTVNLTAEQRNHPKALILFSVKDKDMFGMNNQYIAECYVRFDQISTTEEDASKEQMHLKLSRPKLTETSCIRALEHRQGDKLAKDFLKKLRQKDGSF